VDTPTAGDAIAGRNDRRLVALATTSFLKADRDLAKAGERLPYVWDAPARIDALFLEWRWTIPGRNAPAATPGP